MKNELFKINNNNNIFNKIIMFFIERWILKLNSKNIKKYPQMVIFSFEYISTNIMLNGRYEKEELEILILWLKALQNEFFKGIALDIGANIGNHSLFLANYFDEIHSFEPQKLTYKILEINSSFVENIKAHNFGISSKNYISNFLVEKNNMGGSRVDNSYIENKNTNIIESKLELKKLDSINEQILKNKKIKLIKIDIEGHEYEALHGAEETIKKNQPVIIFEQHHKDFFQGKSKSIEKLKEYGYKKFACIEKKPNLLLRNYPRINLIYSLFYRVFVGATLQIVLTEKFVPKFYPFIIAIPEWIELNKNE